MDDSRVLRLDGCHDDDLGRHHDGNTGNMAPYDAVNIAVYCNHNDERWQDAAEEVEVDHVSKVDNGHERARRSINKLGYFPCRTHTHTSLISWYRCTCVGFLQISNCVGYNNLYADYSQTRIHKVILSFSLYVRKETFIRVPGFH